MSLQLTREIEVHETADGVCYRVLTDPNGRPSVSLVFGLIVVGLTLVAAATIYFFATHIRQLDWSLVAASALFLGQLVFLARFSATLFSRQVLQWAAQAWGHTILELRGERLLLRTGVGPVQSMHARRVRDFQRLAIYAYPLESSDTEHGSPAGPSERYAFAVEGEWTDRWFLVDGLPRDSTLALAEDLRRRLADQPLLLARPLPTVEITPSNQEALYPTPGPEYYRTRRPIWLAWHLSGTIGLGAVTAAIIQTPVWQLTWVRAIVTAGWVCEFIVLGITVYLPNWTGRVRPENN